MAKIRNGLTEEKIKRLLNEGRGKGTLSAYKPLIEVHDVSSSGRATRIKGWKTDRIHHVLSDLERNYLLLLDFDDNVTDIQEQFPLNREDTIKIAGDLDIKHPKDPISKEPIIMTTDFYITAVINGQIKHFARTCKYEDRLKKPRVLEKFEIERRYWASKCIDWGIITEKQINKVMTENLRNLHRYHWLNENDPCMNQENCGFFLNFIFNEYRELDLSIAEITAKFDYVMQLETGTGIELFKYLVANKVLKIDLTKSMDLREIKLEEVEY
jgi:hypothetical protein